jgi:hypothetical protein
VVDAVQLRLVDQGVQALVELPRRRKVVPERLLDDHARVLREPCVGKAAHDRREERGRNLEVEDREALALDFVGDASVRPGVREVAVNI